MAGENSGVRGTAAAAAQLRESDRSCVRVLCVCSAPNKRKAIGFYDKHNHVRTHTKAQSRRALCIAPMLVSTGRGVERC